MTRDEREVSLQIAPSRTPESPGPTTEELVALLDQLPALVAHRDGIKDLRSSLTERQE